MDLLQDAKQEAKRSICVDCNGLHGCDEDNCTIYQNEVQSILEEWSKE